MKSDKIKTPCVVKPRLKNMTKDEKRERKRILDRKRVRIKRKMILFKEIAKTLTKNIYFLANVYEGSKLLPTKRPHRPN